MIKNKTKYVVSYVSPSIRGAMIEVETCYPENVRTEARRKLRLKLGEEAAYCTIVNIARKGDSLKTIA